MQVKSGTTTTTRTNKFGTGIYEDLSTAPVMASRLEVQTLAVPQPVSRVKCEAVAKEPLGTCSETLNPWG